MTAYEAKIWQHGDIWKAEILRNGISYSLDHDFTSRDEALDWAKHRVDEHRSNDEAKATAERVEL